MLTNFATLETRGKKRKPSGTTSASPSSADKKTVQKLQTSKENLPRLSDFRGNASSSSEIPPASLCQNPSVGIPGSLLGSVGHRNRPAAHGSPRADG
jgi:hypothetical protein